MVKRVAIDHVTAIVGDGAEAAAALSRILGVSAPAPLRLPSMDIRTFRVGNVELHVNAPTGPGPVADHHRGHGTSFHHLALRVESLEGFLASLEGSGIVARGAPVATGPGIREVFLDPETTGGLWIQLVERDPEGCGELDPEAIERLARAQPLDDGMDDGEDDDDR